MILVWDIIDSKLINIRSLIRKYWWEKTLKLINVWRTFLRHLRVFKIWRNVTYFWKSTTLDTLPYIEGLAKSQGKVGGPWRMMVPIWPPPWTFEAMGGHLSFVKGSTGSYFKGKMGKVQISHGDQSKQLYRFSVFLRTFQFWVKAKWRRPIP